MTVPDDSTTVLPRHRINSPPKRPRVAPNPLVYVEDSTAPATTISTSPPETTMSTSVSYFFAATSPAYLRMQA